VSNAKYVSDDFVLVIYTT